MAKYTVAKPEYISLKKHPQLNEMWLQEQIANDPSILGLGDVAVLDRERRQDTGGRLDMLLIDPAEDRRYEVELQLGPTDEKHIIRCLEYYDIERRRYPQYDHCAVLVAEDITSRFLNVLGLFNGHVPIIAIQLSSMIHSGEVILNFVRVIDRVSLRRDDEAEVNLVHSDRAYWANRVGEKKVALCDELLGIINSKSNVEYQLNYNKYYIGLADSGRSRNFINFLIRKSSFQLRVDVPNPEEWQASLDELGIQCDVKRKLRIYIDNRILQKNHSVFEELIAEALNFLNS